MKKNECHFTQTHRNIYEKACIKYGKHKTPIFRLRIFLTTQGAGEKRPVGNWQYFTELINVETINQRNVQPPRRTYSELICIHFVLRPLQ